MTSLRPNASPSRGDRVMEPTDEALREALHRSGQLVAVAATLAVALGDIGGIDLPPASGARVDQAQLRAIASLYLASELESAGVIPAVETLAGLSRSGGLSIDLGQAAPLVAQFWKSRNDRATADERAACFARLFGAGSASENAGAAVGFDEAMLELCEALYKLDELATNATYGGIAQQTRVRAAAQNMVDQLVNAAGGITVFLAQEILQGIREALAILGNAAVRGAFGARDVWAVIGAIDRLTRARRADARQYVRRGKAGMTVLSWLADAAVHLDDQRAALVGLDHPVITAAVDWMQAALAIEETGASRSGLPAAPAPSAQPAPSGSPWAAIAA